MVYIEYMVGLEVKVRDHVMGLPANFKASINLSIALSNIHMGLTSNLNTTWQIEKIWLHERVSDSNI
jgi:hypothetical protein